MHKETLQANEIKLIGLKTRTSNNNESYTANEKIFDLVMNQYYGQASGDKIPNRQNPGIVFAAYTEYETDYNGEYTYFIGEEVTSLDTVPEGFSTLVVPCGNYTKFTTDSGPMPQIIIEAWSQIWQMTANDFGGTRSYKTDFEVYNQTNHDLDTGKTIAEIYIGIDQAA